MTAKIGPEPVFDPQRCQTSGWCVAICPTRCLELFNDLPCVLYPSLCASCAACVLVCPTGAATIPGFQKKAIPE